MSPLPLSNADLPPGFRLYGLRCGISAVKGKKDLALFLSDRPARAGGVFTTNLVKAAPVRHAQAKLAKSAAARAVLINSGCANACTGKTGEEDVRWTAQALAEALACPPSEILLASTGVIGRPLPRPALKAGIAQLARSLGQEPSAENAVRAIMTTDTRPKAARAVVKIDGRPVTIWGCAKGAGMIHPNMATMLAVVLTDAGLGGRPLRAALLGAARTTFNCVTIDGDTSTNDSLFILDNGAPRAFSARSLARFGDALEQVCLSLSTQIAADGEGATRVAWITVRGAKTAAAAHRFASTVATSPLVKTALHGADPNWGRILAAIGRAGVPFDPGRVDVRIGNVLVCKKGGRAPHSEAAVHKALKRPEVKIDVDMGQGKASSRYLTCDFSKEYVSINADYTT